MNDKIEQVPDEFKQLADDFSKNGFITTSLDNLINWSRYRFVAHPKSFFGDPKIASST